MNKYYIILTDDNKNNYGILKVVSGYNDRTVYYMVRDLIREFDNEEDFFEDFSSNLSIVIDKLDKNIKEKFGDSAYTEFEYFNTDIFNVDRVFSNNSCI